MKKFLTGLILVFSATCIFSQSSSAARLSVEDAVALALKNNVSISRNKISLENADRTQSHSWNSISPSLSIGTSTSVPVDALSDKESNYSSSTSLNATLSLSFSANLFTSIKSSRLAWEQQKITYDEAVRSVEATVRQGYFELLYELENLQLQEENLKMAKTQYENNLKKYNLGRLNEIDVISAEVNYKSKIPTVESAKTVYQNDLDSFKQVLGLILDDSLELTGTLKDMLYLEEISIDEKNIHSSSVKALESKLESAKNSVLDKRFSAYAPSISASFNWRDQSFYTGYKGTAPDATKSSTVTLNATIPLDGFLPWSSRNDAVDTAQSNVQDLELQLDNEKKNLKRSVDSSLRSIRQSQEAVRYKQANVALAQKTYNMTLDAYNLGTKDLLSLQNANNTLLNAKVSLNNEILTLTKAILTLEKTTGVQFGTLAK